MPEDAPRCALCGIRVTHWTDVAPGIDAATVDCRCPEHAGVSLGVTAGATSSPDPQLIKRLTAAFLRANEAACYGDDSQWKTIRTMHDAVVTAVREGKTDEVASYIARPHEGYLHYGFDDLGVWSVDAYRRESRRTWYAIHCYDLLLKLARALGVLRVPNPECPSRDQEVPEIPTLLDHIERTLGISIRPPDVYPFYYGLKTDRGVLSERVLNAIYCAWRIREITRAVARPRIVEIGAGLGRVADYCHRMGLTDYSIVDVPLTSLVQGHFLASAVGKDRLVLDGELPRRDAIKIFTPERFFEAAHSQVDLVVNVDSLTEFGRDMATRYLRVVAKRASVLFSVNHEANEITVSDLCTDVGEFKAAQRSPYWMRPGYVEELFEPHRARRDARRGWLHRRLHRWSSLPSGPQVGVPAKFT
jgi:hypothetical protein